MSPLRHRLCDIFNQGNYTWWNGKIIVDGFIKPCKRRQINKIHPQRSL